MHHCTINFVGNQDARNVGTLLSHFGVPRLQVGVGDFAGDVESLCVYDGACHTRMQA